MGHVKLYIAYVYGPGTVYTICHSFNAYETPYFTLYSPGALYVNSVRDFNSFDMLRMC